MRESRYICDGCNEQIDGIEPHLCVEGRSDTSYGEEHYCYSCASDIEQAINELYGDDDRGLLEWALSVMRGNTEEQ